MFSPILRQTRHVITKKPRKGPRHGDEAFSVRSVGWSAASAVWPLAYHRGGENAEGTGENADRAPAFHACQKSAVLRPFDADRATRMDAPATIRVGRFSPGSGGENGKAATDRRDRSRRRFCAYSRTNVSVRHPKPSKGVWLSHYVRLHKVYINTVGTVPKTRKIYPLYTN